jgi:Fe-S-cluster-containing dehydrogenase component
MAILQDVDKCMRCNGCVTACKREWNLKLPTDIADVKPARSLVNPRQRLAIKSIKRGDMGPFMRFTCWHCPDPPCVKSCPLKAMAKQATGAVTVDNALCNPDVCNPGPGPKPCETGCQRGGYPKVGKAYQSGAYAEVPRMNKCTLCFGRAGSDAQTGSDALPTRATAAEISAVPEKAHEPACVSSCPAKAMKWDSRANILTYLNDPANGYILANGTQNWYGGGSLYWASRKIMLVPPKADPFIEDHIAPMTASLLGSSRMIVPTLVVGGLAALGARKSKVAEEESMTGEGA